MARQANTHPACQFRTDKRWLDQQYHAVDSIVKPHELGEKMDVPPAHLDQGILDRVQGSMIGMAIGDALGAFVEFRPRQFLVENPVKDLKGGGTWGLAKGQFTDDTSMALCLANSLIARRDFVPYDQLVRYKWWYKHGYMSSTGKCFDIGAATKKSLKEFENRQTGFAKKHRIPDDQMDKLSDPTLLSKFNVYCSEEGVAGNGALMRLAPVPLFFWKYPQEAIAFSGFSGVISHGDRIAFDACRYYGALIVAAVQGLPKNELLSKKFYRDYQHLFNDIPLHPVIMKIAEGSYQVDRGYDDGIRGQGYIASALEAALWAFWNEDSFEGGALAAVNLGDDTDTTAAIYGQLAGAHYGYRQLPEKWLKHLYGRTFIERVSQWLVYEAEGWQPGHAPDPIVPSLMASSRHKETAPEHPKHSTSDSFQSNKKASIKSQSPSGASLTNLAGTTDILLHNSAFSSVTDAKIESERHSLNHWYPSYSSIPSDSGKRLQTYEDVYQWILSLDKGYTKYADALKADWVDGFWLCNYIDDHNLSEKYGVKNSDHRRHILERVQQLKAVTTVKV